MTTDVAIIGAGPYGLSVAANMLQAGLKVRIFGRPMEMWKDHMPEGMLLKSDGFATNLGAMPLTLEEFCLSTGRAYKPIGHRIPLDDLIAYAAMFQLRYVNDVEDIRVTHIQPKHNGFTIALSSGQETFASRVVVATGLTGLQRMPVIDGLPVDDISHVSQHHELRRFTGSRVLVIGGGQSAFETAALLHEQGAKVETLSRRPPLWFKAMYEGVPSTWTRFRHPNWGLGPGWRNWIWSEAPRLFHYLPTNVRLANAYSTFGPAGSGWLRDRVIGKIDHTVGRIISAKKISTGLRVFSEAKVFEVDHVIAATGYEADLRKLGFMAAIAPGLDYLKPGIPSLDVNYQTSQPGLYVVGYPSAASLGPSMRFIYGTNRCAPALTRSVKTAISKTVIGYRGSKSDLQPAS